MKIHVHKTITIDDINGAEIIDDGKDEITIHSEVIIIDLVNKLTKDQELQLSKALKKDGMEIVLNNNGKVKYFN